MEFTAWVFALMMSFSPEDKVLAEDKSLETEDQRRARLHHIAETVVRIVDEEDPFIAGPSGREYTATMILAVTGTESGRWSKVVDEGLFRERLPKTGKQDYGRSWCDGQINLGKRRVPIGNEVMRTWTGPDLVADHYKCLKVTTAFIRSSLGSCRRLPQDQWLNQYATGVCTVNPLECKGDAECLQKQQRRMRETRKASRDKMAVAATLFMRKWMLAPESEPVAPLFAAQ